MSTNIGTLQAPRRLGNAFWPILIALFVATALTVYVATGDRDTGRSSTTVTKVSGTAANTPTELRGGLPAGAGATAVGQAGIVATTHAALDAATGDNPSGGLPAGAGARAVGQAGIVATTHAALDAATGDNPSGSPDRPEGPIGFHPLP